MSGRRRMPEPVAQPGVDPVLNPPEEYSGPLILASTDPSEAPQPPPPPGEEEPFFSDSSPEVPTEDEEEELSPEEQVMFASLMTCGRRSKSITLFDHTVVVQTLNGDDDLRIAMFVKEFAGSVGEQRAYQIGVAAAGIRTVNGAPLVATLFEKAEPDDMFDQRVAKVRQMYPHVISSIYKAVMETEKEFVKLATRLGKFDG